jgi:hypothetical protein
MLVRASRLSQREVARRAECSPSYLSRILSGERVPTWEWTASIATACGGDPALLRELWEGERLRQYGSPRGTGAPTPVLDWEPPVALHHLLSALGTLRVRAGSPRAVDIAAASPKLTAGQVEPMLTGYDLSDWQRLAELVDVLGGDPGYFEPLWRAAAITGSAPAPQTPPATGPVRQGVADTVRQLRRTSIEPGPVP